MSNSRRGFQEDAEVLSQMFRALIQKHQSNFSRMDIWKQKNTPTGVTFQLVTGYRWEPSLFLSLFSPPLFISLSLSPSLLFTGRAFQQAVPAPAWSLGRYRGASVLLSPSMTRWRRRQPAWPSSLWSPRFLTMTFLFSWNLTPAAQQPLALLPHSQYPGVKFAFHSRTSFSVSWARPF